MKSINNEEEDRRRSSCKQKDMCRHQEVQGADDLHVGEEGGYNGAMATE